MEAISVCVGPAQTFLYPFQWQLDNLVAIIGLYLYCQVDGNLSL